MKLQKQQSVRAEIQNVQELMIENIERVLERGERIDSILQRTEDLNRSAVAFKRRTNSIKRTQLVHRISWILAIIFILALFVYLAGTAACGFPAFSRCLPSSK